MQQGIVGAGKRIVVGGDQGHGAVVDAQHRIVDRLRTESALGDVVNDAGGQGDGVVILVGTAFGNAVHRLADGHGADGVIERVFPHLVDGLDAVLARRSAHSRRSNEHVLRNGRRIGNGGPRHGNRFGRGNDDVRPRGVIKADYALRQARAIHLEHVGNACIHVQPVPVLIAGRVDIGGDI